MQGIIKEFNDWCVENKIPIGKRMNTETIVVGDWWIRKVELLLSELQQARQEEIEYILEEVEIEVVGENEEVLPLRITAEAAEMLGKVISASEGRNELRTQQREKLSELKRKILETKISELKKKEGTE